MKNQFDSLMKIIHRLVVFPLCWDGIDGWDISRISICLRHYWETMLPVCPYNFLQLGRRKSDKNKNKVPANCSVNELFLFFLTDVLFSLIAVCFNWPIFFLMNVFIALKRTHFWILLFYAGETFLNLWNTSKNEKWLLNVIYRSDISVLNTW